MAPTGQAWSAAPSCRHRQPYPGFPHPRLAAMSRSTACAALIALGSLTTALAHPPGPERIVPNDNRRPAGKLAHGVLTVALEARSGVWRPEGDSGRSLDVAAFAVA